MLASPLVAVATILHHVVVGVMPSVKDVAEDPTNPSGFDEEWTHSEPQLVSDPDC